MTAPAPRDAGGHVFLSYAAEDREHARHLAEALTARGITVWWDRLITGGSLWGEEIERALEHAWAVVVLWSEASVRSHFVLAEARHAAGRNILIPAMIGTCELPMPFGEYQTIDLTTWAGDRESESITPVLAALDSVRDESWQGGDAAIPRSVPRRARPLAVALGYARELFEFGVGPKTFLLRKWHDPNLTVDAAVFFILSMLVQQIVGLPLSMKLGAPGWDIIGGLIYAPVRLLLLGAIVHMAWRVAGGKTRALVTLSAFTYVFSATALLYEATQNFSVGLLRLLAPTVSDAMFQAIVEGREIGPIQQTIASYGLGMTALFIALTIWPAFVVPYLSWGAFRQANQLSRPQSAIAATLTFALGVPAYALTLFLSYSSIGPG